MSDIDLVQLLTEGSPIVLFAMFIVALLRRWLILPRELDTCEKRIDELKTEKAEYKAIAHKAVGLGEHLAHTTRKGT